MPLIIRPIFKFSNLGDRCGTVFISAFFSGIVANSMLVEFFKEKKISKMQLFLTNWLNQLPAYFLHFPTTIFIVLPLTGFAGLLYFGLTFSAVLLRFVIFIMLSRFYFSSHQKLTSGKVNDFKEFKTNSNSKENIKKPFKISLLLNEKLIPRMAGILSIKETVIVLLMGNIIAFPIRALRHQISRYLEIFSPKMGLSLLLTGQCFRIVSLIIVGLIYYMVG